MTQPAALVAVDVGGTFTDLILFDRVKGEMRLAKAPSTPPDYFLGVVNALTEVIGEDFGAVDLFIHGTTVHLNALLERKGVETGLITTKGFADVYAIGRGNRVRMYDLHFRKPEPIVPRDRIFEVEERLDADGEVLAPLAFADLDRALAAARAGNLRALAICFLHAYRDQEHEAAAAAYLRDKAPDLFIAPSHEVCREWREFERTGTAVVNAYVSPILRNYLRVLAGALAARGFSRKIFLMQSNGGVIAAGDAETRGVLTLMSGPVGGNVGSHALSRLTGRPNLICIDMGGTSFEVSLIVGGEAAAATEKTIAGVTVLAPMVDVHSIGAGGGSIAWNDDGGLRVGPQSAGAAPGPACYGAGGENPTVTDANLALGRLREDKPLAGRITPRPALAQAAIDRLGQEFGLSTTDMAEGILRVINARMANAIRTMTVRRGIDPREFALVAFGGAGPMHAPFIGEELGIRETIVPNFAGAFSAWGMLKTTMKHDLAQTYLTELARTAWRELEPRFQALETELRDRLAGDGMAPAGIAISRSLDLRYSGQEYYLTIPLAGIPRDEPGFQALLKTRFDEAYESTYGHKNVAEQLELVNLRIQATAPLYPGAGADAPDRFVASSTHEIGGDRTRPVVFNGRAHETRFIGRGDIATGDRLAGPMIIEEQSCTSVVPPGYGVSLDALGNLIIRREEA